MGRKSFTQELKQLAKASEGMGAGGCSRRMERDHRELGADGGRSGSASCGR